ncbi:MAG: argininosuccinate lyase, partial [Balneolaceae bacterium]
QQNLMSKLWQQNKTGKQTDAQKQMEAFTVGNDHILDQVLVPYDLMASVVHAEALKDANVLSDDEFQSLKNGLDEIHETWKLGNFQIRQEDEDMHTAIENELTSKLGDLGKKIHTARSRNDQVLTALRLFEKEKLVEVLNSLKKSAALMLSFSETNQNVPMPGFTHTRKAMLSSVGLWGGAFAEMMILQIKASSGVQSLINRSPLGTAAGFGTSFPIDRSTESDRLGFESPIICSTTAQLSRGWIELQLVQYLSGVTSVLNRLASDVILYTGDGFPFFEMNRDITTGSSIMPQKKNPDLAELIRGRHAELTGNASTLQHLISNLGSGYHRDLQLTKKPVLNAFENTLDILSAGRLLIQNLKPNTENLKNACSSELFAAEEANKLVKEKGVSFREAYQIIKETPENNTTLNWTEVKNQYTHLGSPGNPGLKELRKELETCS